MVDWGVARQIARLAAGSEPVPDLGLDLPATARELEGPVIEHTGLVPEHGVPPVEVITRADWAEANLGSLAEMLGPVTERLDRRLDSTGPFAGALRLATGVTLAAEVGLVTGYMGRHVLGQYELSLLAPETAPRLLLVAPNLDAAQAALGVDRVSFVRWVTIHELVHAVQFGGVPWLRDHLGGLMREYTATLDVEITRGAAGGLPSLPDPAALVARFREGGLAALVQTREQRRLMERIQATMAVVEGHAEHVMDALAPQFVPEHEGLRHAMERRRDSASAPQRALMKLLGMDLKMRQYREGKAFCDTVVAAGGIEALNVAWRSPESLPTMAELRNPPSWLRRIATPA